MGWGLNQARVRKAFLGKKVSGLQWTGKEKGEIGASSHGQANGNSPLLLLRATPPVEALVTATINNNSMCTDAKMYAIQFKSHFKRNTQTNQSFSGAKHQMPMRLFQSNVTTPQRRDWPKYQYVDKARNEVTPLTHRRPAAAQRGCTGMADPPSPCPCPSRCRPTFRRPPARPLAPLPR